MMTIATFGTALDITCAEPSPETIRRAGAATAATLFARVEVPPHCVETTVG